MSEKTAILALCGMVFGKFRNMRRKGYEFLSGRLGVGLHTIVGTTKGSNVYHVGTIYR